MRTRAVAVSNVRHLGATFRVARAVVALAAEAARAS
jgi:hypothetical protein